MHLKIISLSWLLVFILPGQIKLSETLVSPVGSTVLPKGTAPATGGSAAVQQQKFRHFRQEWGFFYICL